MARIADLLADGRTFSFEFFPPKTDAAQLTLGRTIAELEPLGPSFVSVTYGAGGSTRERTHEVVAWVRRETAITPMAHLTCDGHRRVEIAEILDLYRGGGHREHPRPRRRSAARPVRGPARATTATRPSWSRTSGGAGPSASASPPIRRATPARRAGRPTVATWPTSWPRPTSPSPSSSSTPSTTSAWSTSWRELGVDKPVHPGHHAGHQQGPGRAHGGSCSGAAFPAWLADRLEPVADPDEVRRIGVEVATELCRGAPGRRRAGARTSTRSTARPRPARSTPTWAFPSPPADARLSPRADGVGGTVPPSARHRPVGSSEPSALTRRDPHDHRSRATAYTQPVPYLPGLDGLRALAVIAVLLYHADVAAGCRGGFLGVEVFFVISGYLITLLLLAEYRRGTGRHRAASASGSAAPDDCCPRSTLLLVRLADRRPVRPRGADAAPRRRPRRAHLHHELVPHLRRQSYFDQFGRPSLLRHLWSLAVEEQFYLVWPLRPRAAAGAVPAAPGPRMAIPMLGAGGGSTVLMAVLYDAGRPVPRLLRHRHPRRRPPDRRRAGPVLAAGLARPGHAGRRQGPRPRLVGLGGLGSSSLSHAHRRRPGRASSTGAASCCVGAEHAAPCIAMAAHPGSRRSPRCSASRSLVWIGVRSYAIYLWHWPVYCLTRPGLDVAVGARARLLVVRLVVTGVLAELSYRLVERPDPPRRHRPLDGRSTGPGWDRSAGCARAAASGWRGRCGRHLVSAVGWPTSAPRHRRRTEPPGRPDRGRHPDVGGATPP